VLPNEPKIFRAFPCICGLQPANFRGSRHGQNARPNPPKSETSAVPATEAAVQGSPNPEYPMAYKIDRPHDHDQHDSSPQEETDESPTLVVFGFIHERTLRPVCPLPPACA
jgi:hypothetical protein